MKIHLQCSSSYTFITLVVARLPSIYRTGTFSSWVWGNPYRLDKQIWKPREFQTYLRPTFYISYMLFLHICTHLYVLVSLWSLFHLSILYLHRHSTCILLWVIQVNIYPYVYQPIVDRIVSLKITLKKQEFILILKLLTPKLLVKHLVNFTSIKWETRYVK